MPTNQYYWRVSRTTTLHMCADWKEKNKYILNIIFFEKIFNISFCNLRFVRWWLGSEFLL